MMIDIKKLAARIGAGVENSRLLSASQRAVAARTERAIAERRLAAFADKAAVESQSGAYTYVRGNAGEHLIETKDGRVMIIIRPGRGIV